MCRARAIVIVDTVRYSEKDAAGDLSFVASGVSRPETRGYPHKGKVQKYVFGNAIGTWVFGYFLQNRKICINGRD